MPNTHRIFRNASSTLLALGVLSVSGFLACTTDPPTEVEVTREVPVTVQVPVTVESVQTVESTREIPVTREVPVTVVVPTTVEVTRTVETVQQVEVTREVPVTRIVAATPATAAPTAKATLAPTIEPTPAVATPAPTPTAQPEPEPQTAYGDWRVKETNHGSRKMLSFEKEAVDYETAGQPPILAFQCDTQGYRSLYIDWQSPLATKDTTGVSLELAELFDDADWQDRDAKALGAYTEGLHAFVNSITLDQYEQTKLDKVWTDVQRLLNPSPNTPEGLVRSLQNRWARNVEIDLEFFVATGSPNPAVEKYGQPILETISGDWMVLSGNRTRMMPSEIGSLRPATRALKQSAYYEVDGHERMAAIVKKPEQIGPAVATWDVDGLADIIAHCRTILR